MFVFGENFFKVNELKKQTELKHVQKASEVKEVQVTTEVHKDAKNERHDEECVGCENKDTEHCEKCLKVLKLYC